MRAAPDEEALALAFAAKQRWAFDEAYKRYGKLLYSAAFRVLENAQDAQDCVHDVLVRIWRSEDSYARSRGTLGGFLAVCARNEAITRMRSRARRRNAEKRLTALAQEQDELHIPDFIEARRVRAALRSLPPEQARPLEMAFFEQKTHLEVAAELRQPLGTVKSRIAAGLRKLGAALGNAQ